MAQLPEGGLLSRDLRRGAGEAWWSEGRAPGGGTAVRKPGVRTLLGARRDGGWAGQREQRVTRGAGAPGASRGGQGTSPNTLLSLLPDFPIAAPHVCGCDHFNENEAMRTAAPS